MVSTGDGIKKTGAGIRSESIRPEDVFAQSETSDMRQLLNERLDELKAIPRTIAQNPGLRVVVGEEGRSSYCMFGGPAGVRVDRVAREIFIDPQHLLDEGSKFIIAHEGMHAAVTQSAFDRTVYNALKRVCDPESLYQEVGFASLLNYLEDCGGNSWLTKNYPAFKEAGQKLYDSMLTAENPQMHTGETQAVMARLGFFPRFAQFGSEIMKRWHTGAYSTKLDSAVAKALAAQQANVDLVIEAFPDGRMLNPEELDTLFCKRFFISANKIMPAIRTLVSDDKAQAAMQQFLNEQTGNNSLEGQQVQQPGSEQWEQGQQESGQSSGGEGAGQPQPNSNSVPDGSRQPDGGAPSPGGGQLSPNVQQEINEKTREHRDALRTQLKEQLDQLSKHLGGSDQDSAGQNEQQKEGATSTPTHEDLANQIDELKKKIAEKFDDAKDKDARKEVENHLETLEKLHNSIDSQATPLDSLSEPARQELKDLYDQQTAQDKKRWKEAGEELLKEFEDAIREMLEGKLQEQTAPTHRERREAKEAAQRAAHAYQEAEENAKRLEELRRSRLSLWDAAREDVAGLIGTLYSRLERVLRPTVPEWQTGYATGNRINTTGAMQAEADPRLASQMWEQRSLLIEREFVFSLLVDNSFSMSMSGDEKFLHARRCAVLLSEVLTRLKVPFEITIFSNDSEVLRTFSDKPGKEKKNQIGSAINGQGGGTQDYDAVQERVTSLSSRSEENKFLIVITDGGSNDPTQLKDALAEALQKGIRVVGLGVGGETADVDKYYPIGRGGLTLDPKDKESALGPYFATLLEEILKNPEQFVTKALKEKSKQKETSEEG